MIDQEYEFSTCKECGGDYDTSDLNDAMLCRLCACTHERVECPNHEGNFDCTPFCRLCEGDQEYCPTCEDVPPLSKCDNCGNRVTLWIECDDCVGYEPHPHYFSACAECYLTSKPFVEKGTGE